MSKVNSSTRRAYEWLARPEEWRERAIAAARLAGVLVLTLSSFVEDAPIVHNYSPVDDKNPCVTALPAAVSIDLACEQTGFPNSPDAITRRVMSATVALSFAPGGIAPNVSVDGTGFKVSPGMVFTAGHAATLPWQCSMEHSAVIGEEGANAIIGTKTTYGSGLTSQDIAAVFTAGEAFDALPAVPLAPQAGEWLKIGERMEIIGDGSVEVDGRDYSPNAFSPVPDLRQPNVIDAVFAGVNPYNPNVGFLITGLGSQTGGQKATSPGSSGSPVVLADGPQEGRAVGVLDGVLFTSREPDILKQVPGMFPSLPFTDPTQLSVYTHYPTDSEVASPQFVQDMAGISATRNPDPSGNLHFAYMQLASSQINGPNSFCMS